VESTHPTRSDPLDIRGSAIIAGVFGWKPNEILLSFRDRIEAQNGIITTAWPYHVHIQSARRACLRTKAGCNQSLGRGNQFGPTLQSPAGGGRVTSSRRCSWKTIFPPRWRSGITSLTPSFSAAPSTTSTRALDAIDKGGSACRLLVSAAPVTPRSHGTARTFTRYSLMPISRT
jgi:hypothetical protein